MQPSQGLKLSAPKTSSCQLKKGRPSPIYRLLLESLTMLIMTIKKELTESVRTNPQITRDANGTAVAVAAE